jgi:hypothetical protein
MSNLSVLNMFLFLILIGLWCISNILNDKRKKKSNLFKTKLVEPILDIKAIPPPAVVGYEECSLEYSGGWISLDNDEFFKMQLTKDAAIAAAGDIKNWIGHISKEWWNAFHYRNKATIVRECLKAKATLADEKYLNFKRVMTASSILFDFSIPLELFLLDEHSVVLVLKYNHMTQKIKIDIETLSFTPINDFNNIVEVKNLSKTIEEMMRFNIIITAFNSDRPPNCVYLHMVMVNAANSLKTSSFTGELLNHPEGLRRLKKVMTCIYLSCGLEGRV